MPDFDQQDVSRPHTDTMSTSKKKGQKKQDVGRPEVSSPLASTSAPLNLPPPVKDSLLPSKKKQGVVGVQDVQELFQSVADASFGSEDSLTYHRTQLPSKKKVSSTSSRGQEASWQAAGAVQPAAAVQMQSRILEELQKVNRRLDHVETRVDQAGVGGIQFCVACRGFQSLTFRGVVNAIGMAFRGQLDKARFEGIGVNPRATRNAEDGEVIGHDALQRGGRLRR